MILNQSRHPKPWRYKNASSFKQIYKHFNQKTPYFSHKVISEYNNTTPGAQPPDNHQARKQKKKRGLIILSNLFVGMTGFERRSRSGDTAKIKNHFIPATIYYRIPTSTTVSRRELSERFCYAEGGKFTSQTTT